MSVEIEMGASWQLQHAVAVACVTILTIFLFNLYKARRRFQRLRRQGLRMPPHHPIFGHLLLAKELLSALPSDAHPSYLPGLIRRAYPDVGPVFYLDMWPFTISILVVSSPSAAYQVTQEHSLPKSGELRRWIRPLADNKDLVSLEGYSWKRWRSIYNPGFSASHLINLVPQIAQEVSTFCEILRERAQAGAVFPLEEMTVNLTMDVIGRVVLDTHFNAQRSRSQFVSALRAQIPWFSFGAEMNPFQRWNPFRPLFLWYYTQLMDRFVRRQLEQRFVAHQGVDEATRQRDSKSTTVMDLALDNYLGEQNHPKAAPHMDAVFTKYAISQTKVFLLAGHDTTSSTLCYIFYLLTSNPHALQRARAEHDEVFGSNPALTKAAIIADPYSLNRLPFTAAVIKEALRLFSPASSTRDGEPAFSLTEDGRQYPTEGFLVWSMHQAIHREPLYWPQPDTFLPERWLVSKGHPLYPVKGAWRPFEFGPRGCIGQELALFEIKIVIVMVIREFDIKASYAEWDEYRGKKGIRTVNGERAYQALKGTTRPADGFPCKITVQAR